MSFFDKRREDYWLGGNADPFVHFGTYDSEPVYSKSRLEQIHQSFLAFLENLVQYKDGQDRGA